MSRGIDLADIALNAMTMNGIGRRAFMKSFPIEDNDDFDMRGASNFIKYAGKSLLWNGSPEGMILSIAPSESPRGVEEITGTNYGAQLLIDKNTGVLYVRTKTGSSVEWGKWKKINATTSFVEETTSLNTEDMMQNNVMEHTGGGYFRNFLLGDFLVSVSPKKGGRHEQRGEYSRGERLREEHRDDLRHSRCLELLRESDGQCYKHDPEQAYQHGVWLHRGQYIFSQPQRRDIFLQIRQDPESVYPIRVGWRVLGLGGSALGRKEVVAA